MLTKDIDDDESDSTKTVAIPKGLEVFEMVGPLFFGAAHKFRDALRLIEKLPKGLIIRMRNVPVIDATGIKTINEVYKETSAAAQSLSYLKLIINL